MLKGSTLIIVVVHVGAATTTVEAALREKGKTG
jgi:hypothetical protein